MIKSRDEANQAHERKLHDTLASERRGKWIANISGVYDVPDGSGRPRRGGGMTVDGLSNFFYIIALLDPKTLTDEELKQRFGNIARKEGLEGADELRDHMRRRLPVIAVDEYIRRFREVLPDDARVAHSTFRIMNKVLTVRIVAEWRTPDADVDEFYRFATILSKISSDLKMEYGIISEKSGESALHRAIR